MDEDWLDGTLGKDEYWTVEGQIIEVPQPRSIDGVYVIGCPMPNESESDRCPVSEVRLTLAEGCSVVWSPRIPDGDSPLGSGRGFPRSVVQTA